MTPLQALRLDSSAAPASVKELAGEVLGWLTWGVLVALILGIFICVSMLVSGRRNRSPTAYEGLAGLAWLIGGLALASVGALLIKALQT